MKYKYIEENYETKDCMCPINPNLLLKYGLIVVIAMLILSCGYILITE